MTIKKAFLATGFFAAVSLMTACGNSKPTISKAAAEGFSKCVVESKRSAAIMYEAEVEKNGYSVKDVLAGNDCKRLYGIAAHRDLNDYRVTN